MDEATGNPQPSYRLDGLKIMAEFPKLKGDEEQEQDNVERKQVGRGGIQLGFGCHYGRLCIVAGGWLGTGKGADVEAAWRGIFGRVQYLTAPP